eukprot:CAMPEP_0201689294 /NCGR_PEP_ID=MMETSP0578-20130828/2909_1 /ASSEMBLY_ACC=CAM_ASM_000663 /TAXON_ID=267565 /ORGANISM="Skeletonema grethea, Strain CCMP 1804" /LENGTH=407 /DNA_ID=CAMNT_0048173891 /DNA_START=35 /DNA_END=1258 /DNA_ORIENTATION=-
MKWTATVTLTALMQQHTTDLAHAKRIGNRQMQDNYYYPLDITKGICSNDPTTRPSSFTEINFTLFETREECCDRWYSWQEGENCRRNEQIGVPKEVEVEPTEAPPTTTESSSSETTPDETVFFYPMDLITGKCSNDASQRPSDFDSIGFTLFTTLEQCCETWYGWQEDQFCLLNLSTDPPGEPQDPTVPPVTPEDPTVPPANPDGGNGDGDGNGDGNGGSNGGGTGGDDGDDQSDSKFYLVDSIICEASTNGEMQGNYFATQVDCCTNIQDFNSRKICCDEGVDSPQEQLECLLVEAADPVVPQEDDPVVVKEDKPIVEEEGEQFYLSNKNCYSTANGVLTTGTLYSSRFECCNSLGSKEDRHACVWSTDSSPNLQPGATKTPSSASQLARGSYVIAAAVCFCFQSM